MRTKTLLLSAAVGVAGLVAASAQTVYSVNSVGYINLSIPPGFSTFANQLDSSASTLGDIIPNPVDNMRFFVWNGASFDAVFAVDVGGGNVVWSDATIPVEVGVGYFVSNPSAADVNVTLVGEVPQAGASNIAISDGFSMIASTVPQEGSLPNDLGFPSANNDRIFIWNGSAYDIFFAIDVGGGNIQWNADPVVSVGEGFFVDKKGAVDWNRDFSVNQS